MLGLFVLICLYVMLGFLLAWIAGIVAREDVEVSTGVIVLLVTGVVALAARYGLAQAASADVVDLATPVINFAVLTMMLNLIAKLSWKHSAIIAGIYAVVLFLITLGLTSCMA